MPNLKFPNKLTGGDCKIPEEGTDADVLTAVLDLRDMIRDNKRHDVRTAALDRYKEHDRLYDELVKTNRAAMENRHGYEAGASYAQRREREKAARIASVLEKADSEADRGLPETIRSYVDRYLPHPRLSDFQRKVFKELSGFVSEPDAQAAFIDEPMSGSTEENVLKATFHQAGKVILIPAYGDEAKMLTLALDLKDALVENLRVKFSKTANELHENDLADAKKMLEESTDVPQMIKDMIKAGAPLGMLRIGPKGVVTPDKEASDIVQTKLPEAIQKQAQIFLGKQDLTAFQRGVIETFASFAP